MEKEEIIREIKKIIRNYLDDNFAIYLFGSWVKDNALETSDIDIAILGKEKVPWDTFVKISEQIQSLPTLRKIDIVDLNAVSDKFKNNVLESAINVNEGGFGKF